MPPKPYNANVPTPEKKPKFIKRNFQFKKPSKASCQAYGKNFSGPRFKPHVPKYTHDSVYGKQGEPTKGMYVVTVCAKQDSSAWKDCIALELMKGDKVLDKWHIEEQDLQGLWIPVVTPEQVLKLWDHFQNLPNTDTSGLPDVPDLSTFNPRTLELTELSLIKMTENKAVLHGCGAYKLLDKLNAKAITPHMEMAIMKEEGVFGPDTSAYTFDPAHLNFDVVAEVAHEYGFKLTEYEGIED